MDKQTLKQILSQNGLNLTDTQIDEFMNLYSFDEFYNQELSKFDYQIWDRQSPINGISANIILSKYPYADVIYLIYYDGALMYLQPHKPFVSGFVPVTSDEVDLIAQNHIKQIAEQFAVQKYIQFAMQYFAG